MEKETPTSAEFGGGGKATKTYKSPVLNQKCYAEKWYLT